VPRLDSKLLDERSTASPSPHVARPRYALHQYEQIAFSKLPQDLLVTACCVLRQPGEKIPYGKILTPLRGIVTRQRAAAPGCGAQKTLRRVILPRCSGAVPGCRGVTPVKKIRMTWHRVNMTLWGVKTPPTNRT